MSSAIPPEIQQKIDRLNSAIQRADALEQARRVDEAQATYQDCLQMTVRERIPLFAYHLVHIWVGIGFCYADRNDWRGALEWYHRAEAALKSAPSLNSDPKSPEAQAYAKTWSQYLPKESQVLFPESYPAEADLANVYDSIAIAYDNNNQLERAKEYYSRAIEVHVKQGHPEREVQVWWHYAASCQRRQDWFDLEESGTRMLDCAARAKSKPMALYARRFLAQSQINQNRPFKTMEHLGAAVVLGREVQDSQLASDEKLLRDLIKQLRPGILQRSAPQFMEPLVRAEKIARDPNLAQDQALFEKLSHEQPTVDTRGLMPVGALETLNTAAMVLEHFAIRHCGLPTQTDGKSERRVWAISQEEMQVMQKDKQGKLIQGKAMCAVWDLFTQPEVIISVSLTESECNVALMEARALPGSNQTGFYSVARESIPRQSDALLSCLNAFILRGLFVKTGQRLQYISPKR